MKTDRIDGDEKAVFRIWWNGADGDSSLRAEDDFTLTWVSEYHGDRDDEWVIAKKAGREVSRHNCRYIASIIWAVPDATAGKVDE